MPLTPEGKKLLAETIRGTQQDPDKGLRARLLRAIHDEADRRYRLSVPIELAGLDEAHTRHRQRIEAWVEDRARATHSAGEARTSARRTADAAATEQRLLAQAEKEAAATCINRLVLLRHLEALGLSKPLVLTGGWSSKGYREFREFAPTLCSNGTTDATEGYATLLQLVFDELAGELPGLFGDVGLTRLFSVPAATLREVVERLDDPDLASAWTDETTLGWVYQYWNDPDREALDAKINGGSKIAPHEIASKTQMFTERYMVEWLLQNSLGLTWLCMCKRHGWTADAEQTLAELEERRIEWRNKRDAGEVPLDALMPTTGELEDHWKYFVPQPLPANAIENAPASVRSIKLLDPACGSGHFLVIAFGMLAALYREEAKHRGVSIADRDIAESIVENNLYGIDIDPRAIQLAAAGVHLRAKAFAKGCRPRRVNLVAPVLQLGSLPADDPAISLLQKELKQAVGIPEELTTRLLSALAGVDYLGTLLKVDAALDDALRSVELEFERTHGQGDFFSGFPAQQVKLSIGEAKATLLDRLEKFLAQRSKSEDLGLRLDGEQLAAGVRFVRMAKEAAYDVVIGNPPYQSISKTESFGYVARTYPKGKPDLYAAFLERGIQLAKQGGVAALVTMRGWMFLSQFTELRRGLLTGYSLKVLGDLGTGAFSSRSMDDVISTALVVVLRTQAGDESVAIQAGPSSDPRRDAGKPSRRHAALLCQIDRYNFEPHGFDVIAGAPIVYWWHKEFLLKYAKAPKLGAASPAMKGLCTGDNLRFNRFWHELRLDDIAIATKPIVPSAVRHRWVPTIKGADGKEWFEPLTEVLNWEHCGLQLHEFSKVSKGVRVQNAGFYFCIGIAFTGIGARCAGRAHRYASIFGDKGASFFPDNLADSLLNMNSSISRTVMESLNPSVSFTPGDVNRLPVFAVPDSEHIYAVLSHAFDRHEAARESSIEFKRTGPSPWLNAQAWAQRAVDRAEGQPLESYDPIYDAATPEANVSFAVGIALGRFGPRGEGVLDLNTGTGLGLSLLFLSASEADEDATSLQGTSCAELWKAWGDHPLAPGSISKYLRTQFFEFHKRLYQGRPIYFPLSSTRKSFVAFVSIHRWQDDTLNVLLADHLVPTRRRLEGELDDLRVARVSGQSTSKIERRFAEVQKLLEELNSFISKVTEASEKGPPRPDPDTRSREVDARYVMDLDDGVIVNSAALWPLLEPQWKDPKKWWKDLANARGKKDYDWSHLASRYFPTRVKQKCHEDASLAVAHRCLWELHPTKAYAWELRLQDEIRPEYTIDEPGSDAARSQFLSEQPREADKIRADELKRRARKAGRSESADEDEALFENDNEEEPADA